MSNARPERDLPEENPYRSPLVHDELSATDTTPRVGLFRQLSSGLLAGGLIGSGTGAVAGALFMTCLLLSMALFGAETEPVASAGNLLEVGILLVVVEVVLGSLAGGSAGAIIGLLIALLAWIWPSGTQRPLRYFSLILYGAAGAAFGTGNAYAVVGYSSNWQILGMLLGLAAGIATSYLLTLSLARLQQSAEA